MDARWNDFTADAANRRYFAPVRAYEAGRNRPAALPVRPVVEGTTPTAAALRKKAWVGLIGVATTAGLLLLCRGIKDFRWKVAGMVLSTLPGVGGLAYALWDRFTYLDLDDPEVRLAAQVRAREMPFHQFRAREMPFHQFVDSITERNIVGAAGKRALRPEDLARYELFGRRDDYLDIQALGEAYVQARDAYRADVQAMQTLFKGETAGLRARKANREVQAAHTRQHADWALRQANHRLHRRRNLLDTGLGAAQVYHGVRAHQAAGELERAARDDFSYRIAPYEAVRDESQRNLDEAFAQASGQVDQLFGA